MKKKSFCRLNISNLPTSILFEIYFNFIGHLGWFKLSRVCSWSDHVVKLCWERLKKLDLGCYPLVRTDDFGKIILLCRNLKKIRIDCSYLRCSCLLSISDSILSLELESADKMISADSFVSTLSRFKHLNSLKIASLDDKDFKISFKEFNRFLTSTNLAKLELHRINLQEKSSEPKTLSFPSTLKELKVLNCEFTSFPKTLEKIHIRRTKDLASIYGLNHRSIEAITSRCLNLTSITIIDYSNDGSFNGLSLKLISNTYSSLKKLKLSRQGPPIKSVNDISVMILSNSCVHLTSLRLDSFQKITDAGVIEIINTCTNIKSISLSFTQITDDALQAVSTLSLNYLNLKNCKRVSETGLLRLIPYLKSIKKLNLSGLNGVTDNVVDLIETNCKKLEVIQLNNTQITDASLLPLSNLLNLVDVSINFSQISDFTYLINLKNSQNLKSLSLAGSKHLTDVDIKSLSKSMKSLGKLNLQSCNLLTDKAFKYICKELKNLKYLDMKYVRLTVNVIRYLPLACRNLKYLKVSQLAEPSCGFQGPEIFGKFKVLVETNGRNSVIKFN